MYLYLALTTRAGGLSTRVYFDDLEQVARLVLHANLHVERLAQHFTLGNLPVVAGITRPCARPCRPHAPV